MVHIGNSWDILLQEEFEKPYYLDLRRFLKQEYATHTVYPPMHDIFNALKYTPYEDVKVVILGQDPYHGPGQAHGLCFSVQKGVEPPPSLKNIFKEIEDECGIPIPAHGELTGWAKQGVLLLNTVLTVRAASPNSHKGKGWEILTDKVIELLNARTAPIVVMLWVPTPAPRRASSPRRSIWCSKACTRARFPPTTVFSVAGILRNAIIF